MDHFEISLAEDIQSKMGLSFLPYVVTGSEILKKQIGSDMISGNTVTCPGFYAPQGREVRAIPRLPRLLADLSGYHDKESNFWLTNFEMETAGYYAMGRLLGHEILSVNAIIANRIKNKVSKDPNKIIDALIIKVLERI
jgi:uridine phosphorylase